MKVIAEFRIDTMHFEVYFKDARLFTKMVNDDFPDESVETSYENFQQFKEVFEDEIDEEVLNRIEEQLRAHQ